MFKPRNAYVKTLAMILTVASGPALAQGVTLDFTNADMDPIQLLDNTTVGIDGEGNLTAQCVLDDGVCAGLSGPGGPIPAVGLSRTNGTGTITTGNSLALQWTATNSAEVCLASSTPPVAGWNNLLVASAGGSANLTMSTAGTFSLSLKCYNQFGVSNTASVSATVAGQSTTPPPTVPACNFQGVADGNQFVQPTGFTGHMVTWQQLMSNAPFPNGNSFLTPTGSFTLRSLSPGTNGPTMVARYISTEFVPLENKNYFVTWLGVQKQVEVPAYTQARAASAALVAVSPCAGDLRAPNQFTSDPILAKCRGFSQAGSLKFGTTSDSTCKLVAGQKYYLTFAMVNPTEGALSTTTTSCQVAGNRCEINLNGQ